MIATIKNTIKKAVKVPLAGYDYLKETHEAKSYQNNSTYRWTELSFQQDVLTSIENKLKSITVPPVSLTQFDRQLIDEIRKKTKRLNRNNVTRTKAYLDIYKRNPEIHWAFLAHLVSRNGGWNMTDIKGSILEGVLSKEAQSDFFSFLERANALIFHDAYPQLLLYEACKKRNKNLFYLLPKFHVSQFMRPFWDYFFENKDSKLLTVALIINEQNYIEDRVVQHSSYKDKVLNNIIFRLQEVLQFTYVLFPFQVSNNKRRLAGITVSDFGKIKHRIEVGKKLYSIVFGIENLYEDISKFALHEPHTGSRNDCWPKMFTKNINENLHMTSVSCRPKKPIVFSPTIEDAWEDIAHSFTDVSDWYKQGTEISPFFTATSTPRLFDITIQYCQAVHKMIVTSDAYKIVKR